MSNLTHPSWQALQEDLFAEIDKRKRGRLKLAIVTVMQSFGFNASRRVHQASLEWVLSVLTEWGIGYEFPGGTSAYDDIILFRLASASDESTEPVASSENTRLDISGDGSTPVDDAADPEMLPPLSSPLGILFAIDGSPDEAHSHSVSQTIHHAIWAFRPVCLFVDASDELFSFVCGYIAALLRRRALTVRSSGGYELPWIAPEITTAHQIGAHLGQRESIFTPGRFPETGGVYIVREKPDDLEDNELIRAARERLIPHTYSLIARFGATAADPDSNPRLREANQFRAVFRWIAAFAGNPLAAEPPMAQPVDVSSLLTEACQARDALLDQHTVRSADSAFRTGFESTEHMVLKSAMLTALRQRFPGDEVAVEELIEPSEDDGTVGGTLSDRPRRDKPDLRIGSKLWVEVETVRGLSQRGSNPFFALEMKLRQKLAGMRSVQEIWLIVPSDVALLARDQVAAIAQNLNVVLGAEKVRYGFVDLTRSAPVFFEPGPPAQPSAPRLTGVSLRREHVEKREVRSLDDIAGYEDIKRTLRSSLLDPLMQRQKYASYGVSAARGLLLYGLPGCGKSWIGSILAEIAGITSRTLLLSDLTSKWLGEGVVKTREIFDWAAKQRDCLLILDELDAVAPSRESVDMHTDEKRQVNELLVQIDRVASKGVILVATTNYLRGVDAAVQRSGRFDLKLPVFPPTVEDRRALFHYYLSSARLPGFTGLESIDIHELAAKTPLFTPADIYGLIHAAARRSIYRSDEQNPPSLDTSELLQSMREHPRSIRLDQANKWLGEATEDLGSNDDRVIWLRDEIDHAFGSNGTSGR